MNFFKTKYRVVQENTGEYEAQFKPWYSPIWFYCWYYAGRGTHQEAYNLCKKHARISKTKYFYFEI